MWPVISKRTGKVDQSWTLEKTVTVSRIRDATLFSRVHGTLGNGAIGTRTAL